MNSQVKNTNNTHGLVYCKCTLRCLRLDWLNKCQPYHGDVQALKHTCSSLTKYICKMRKYINFIKAYCITVCGVPLIQAFSSYGFVVAERKTNAFDSNIN